jgi:hypothetical protein
MANTLEATLKGDKFFVRDYLNGNLQVRVADIVTPKQIGFTFGTQHEYKKVFRKDDGMEIGSGSLYRRDTALPMNDENLFVYRAQVGKQWAKERRNQLLSVMQTTGWERYAYVHQLEEVMRVLGIEIPAAEPVPDIEL